MATKMIEKRFDSLAAFVEYCHEQPAQWEVQHSTDSAGGAVWSGADSLEQAEQWALYGGWECPDLDKLEGILAEPAANDYMQRIEFVPDVVGCRPNVPAFCAGEPCSMWNAEFVDSERKIVRVLINRSYPHSVTPQQSVHHGAIILQFLHKLETELNVATELDVIIPSFMDGDSAQAGSELTVTVKRAGIPFDLSEFAFALASPAFLRRLYFKYCEGLPAKYETNGYGQPRDPQKATKEQYDVVLPRPGRYGGSDKLKKAIADYMHAM